MNLANERLKTIFSHSAYYFESQTDARVSFSAILIVCTEAILVACKSCSKKSRCYHISVSVPIMLHRTCQSIKMMKFFMKPYTY